MSDTPPAVKRYTLLDSLDPAAEKLKLPLPIMRDVGPAVQTLGGLLRMTNRETYCPVADIARSARVPVATCRKHLATLTDNGWIKNQGRQHTRRGAPRRTSTIIVTKQTTDALEPYGLLPWWACCSIRRVGRLPWCARAVLSVVLARLAALKSAVERQDGCGLDADDLEVSIEAMGGDERFRFGLDWLTAQTGLTRESVISAKRWLNHRSGILDWMGDWTRPGVATTTDYLIPMLTFQVVVAPAPKGGVWLDFSRGSESGQ